MQNIAIIDFFNQDIGLKILFKDANYFILHKEFDRIPLYTKYNFQPIIHNIDLSVFEHIDSSKYDTLLIIVPLYDSLKAYNNKNKPSIQKIHNYLLELIDHIDKNKYKNICFFDNYDYDYDPNIIFEKEFITKNNIKFFKRYYNKERVYKSNVFPFPYIIFGHSCNIDILQDFTIEPNSNKISRIFFAGSPLVHIDKIYGIVRNRKDILEKIKKKMKIYNPGFLSYENFISVMKQSKYSLDLLGVGDPNKRTFEILSSGSLRLVQCSNLQWNFNEDFPEEVIFNNETDLVEKIKRLEKEPGLYEKCLNKQNELVKKYMNHTALKQYIIDKINNNNLY